MLRRIAFPILAVVGVALWFWLCARANVGFWTSEAAVFRAVLHFARLPGHGGDIALLVASNALVLVGGLGVALDRSGR